MSLLEVFDIHLTPANAGKTLTAKLYNGDGTPYGSSITTGFVEQYGGDYTLQLSLPNLFFGSLAIYVSGVYIAETSINNDLPVNVGFWGGTGVPGYVSPPTVLQNQSGLATLANQNILSGQVAAIPTVLQNQSGLATLANQNILSGQVAAIPTVLQNQSGLATLANQNILSGQ